MAEPFKNLIDAAGVRLIRRHLTRAWPGFDGARFEALARGGLEGLELKARAVHHVKARGGRSAKVFKGWLTELAPGERRELEKRHSMRQVTTRRYHAGRHALDVRINGRVVAEASFDLHL